MMHECCESENVVSARMSLERFRRQINKREKIICFHAPCENNGPRSEREGVTPFVLRHSARRHIQLWLHHGDLNYRSCHRARFTFLWGPTLSDLFYSLRGLVVGRQAC